MDKADVDGMEPEEVAALRRQGFTPIEELTGDIERAAVWPDEHRRVVTDHRYRPRLDDVGIPGLTDGHLYLVRSPRPEIDNERAMQLLDRWLRRHCRDGGDGGTHMVSEDQRNAEAARTAMFLRQDQRWVKAYSEGHVRPTEPI